MASSLVFANPAASGTLEDVAFAVWWAINCHAVPVLATSSPPCATTSNAERTDLHLRRAGVHQLRVRDRSADRSALMSSAKANNASGVAAKVLACTACRGMPGSRSPGFCLAVHQVRPEVHHQHSAGDWNHLAAAHADTSAWIVRLVCGLCADLPCSEVGRPCLGREHHHRIGTVVGDLLPPPRRDANSSVEREWFEEDISFQCWNQYEGRVESRQLECQRLVCPRPSRCST